MLTTGLLAMACSICFPSLIKIYVHHFPFSFPTPTVYYSTFAPSWNHGLFCFHIVTSSLGWHLPQWAGPSLFLASKVVMLFTDQCFPMRNRGVSMYFSKWLNHGICCAFYSLNVYHLSSITSNSLVMYPVCTSCHMHVPTPVVPSWDYYFLWHRFPVGMYYIIIYLESSDPSLFNYKSLLSWSTGLSREDVEY